MRTHSARSIDGECNFAGKKANASCRNPVFVPYIHIDYSKKPCAPSIVENGNALNSFKNKMKQFKSPKPLSIQRYVLYRWRFLMAASLCNAFGRFGGTVAQLNNLSITIQIAIVGNPNIAMMCGEELRNRLAKYAMGRTPNIDYFHLLSLLQTDIVRTAPRRAAWRLQSNTRTSPIKKGGKSDTDKGAAKGGKRRVMAMSLKG